MAVFAFDRENWCSVFCDGEEAEASIEVIDVEANEYVLFDDEGTVLNVSLDGGKVVIGGGDSRDPQQLHERLERYCGMVELDCPSDDPIAVGNAILLSDWSRRWPKRPAWLDRRLHGDSPHKL